MLRVQRNQQNNLVVSVSRHKTIPNAQYLFSFEHIISKEKVRFYPKNISTHENRYDEFVFFEGETPVNYTGDIPYEIFPYPGQYYYSIWEAFTQNSTNPNSAYDKLEEGRCVVYDNTNETPYRYTYTSNNEENANYIYYQPGTNKTGGLQVAISYSAYNQHLQYYTWSVNYPDLIVEDLLTENKIRSANTLYENGYCAGGFNASSGLTTHVDIITGSTSSGFKVYLDPDQMLRLNYVATSGITLTATTYYDFTEAAGSYSCKTIEYYSDGSSVEIPTQPLFEVDMTPPTNVSFSISGNTDCVIPPTPTPTQTPTSTSTPTPTLTATPTGTPNPICPQELTYTWDNPFGKPYNPNFTADSNPIAFIYENKVPPYNPQYIYSAGTAPDGNDYAVFVSQSGTSYWNLIRSWDNVAITGTSIWFSQQTTGNTFANGGVIGVSALVSTASTTFNGVRYITPGTQQYLGGYMTYPISCPSPTPTPTTTETPTQTPTTTPTPTLTPTNTETPTPTPTSTPAPTFDPDAQAFFDAITTSGGTITETEEDAINNLVLDLKGYSLWDKMIGLYAVVGTTSITQSFNLKDTTQYNLGFNGTWAHTSGGAEPSSNGYATTGIIPSVINFQLSGSIHYSMYITENNAGGRYDMGSFQGGQDFAFISSFAGNNTTYIGVNSGFFTTANGGSTKKNWLVSNDGSTSYIYRDGVSIASGAKTIGSGSNVDISISSNNNNGSYADFGERNWALASIGLGMDATEAANYNTAVLTYQTALGRQN
jgi:hypothetical protein